MYYMLTSKVRLLFHKKSADSIHKASEEKTENLQLDVTIQMNT
jgi:hypothetical protein